MNGPRVRNAVILGSAGYGRRVQFRPTSSVVPAAARASIVASGAVSSGRLLINTLIPPWRPLFRPKSLLAPDLQWHVRCPLAALDFQTVGQRLEWLLFEPG